MVLDRFLERKKINVKVGASTSVFLIVLLSLVSVQTGSSTDVLGIDISVSPNPIPCGGVATVTATIKTPMRTGPVLRGTAKLWDSDSWFRDGDDLLDQADVWLFDKETTVTFTLRCDIKEGDCDLYGPNGNSGESSTDVFVSFYEYESAEIKVKCEQYEVEGEVSLDGSDTVLVGDETGVVITAENMIENVTMGEWGIHYDASVFDVVDVTFLHPELIERSEQGLLIYDLYPEENRIDFSLLELLPLHLDGGLVDIRFLVKSDSPTLWDTTMIWCTENSTFYNLTGDTMNICLGGNHSVFIAPADTTSPIINTSLITFSQGEIIGSPGSISDSEWRHLENYLTVTIYDENEELVAETFVQEDGGFHLDTGFWLDANNLSTITAYNGVNLSASYLFIPIVSCNPSIMPTYQTYLQNTTANPGGTINISFDIQNKCDTSETYRFTIANTQAWEIEQHTFNLTLASMENQTVVLPVSIPCDAVNRTENTFTVTMTSRTYPDKSESASAMVTVVVTAQEPDGDDDSAKEETPGFEMPLSVIVILIVFLLKRKRKM